MMDVNSVLRGVSGMATLVFFAGMLYFGFILMRSCRKRPATVFFWAVICQVVLVAVMAVMSAVMGFFGNSMLGWAGGGSVDWLGMASSILEGTLVLCGLVAAVAMVMSTIRDRH